MKRSDAEMTFLPSARRLLFCCTVLWCLCGYMCKGLDQLQNSQEHVVQLGFMKMEEKRTVVLPQSSAGMSPERSVPFSGPLSLVPFKNISVPKLSGLCRLNFSYVGSLISTTAVDCWGSFAHLVASVICCPQFHTTMTILIGKLSITAGTLVFEESHANHCLSDVQQILAGQGANDKLMNICSIYPSNITASSCPVKNVSEFERIVDISRLLAACKNVDPVTECCSHICQNEISDAAVKLVANNKMASAVNSTVFFAEHSARTNDCREIVLRWLAGHLKVPAAKQVLRQLSSCKLNEACPLAFPDVRHLGKYCENDAANGTNCCTATENYISHLQKQSFITNLQALDCAALLGAQLRKANITKNIYNICHITLKDFSLQVGSQESGCLLPSLPSDLTFDQSSGVSFTCDLNDNIAASWPSASQQALSSSCNTSVRFPLLPTAISASNDHSINDMDMPLILVLAILAVIL